MFGLLGVLLLWLCHALVGLVHAYEVEHFDSVGTGGAAEGRILLQSPAGYHAGTLHFPY